MLKIVKLMLKEEYRLHTSFSHKLEFLLFPVLNFLFVLVCCLLSPQLLKKIPLDYFKYLLASGLFLYGIFMGIFVFFGSDYIERQFGKVAFLITAPLQHPVSFKKIYLAFFIHDVIFYFIFTIIPISLALLVSAPIMGFPIDSVGLLALCATLSFIFGISVSFFSATLYQRSIPVFMSFSVIIVASVCLMVIGPGYGFLFPAYQLLVTRSLPYLAASIVIPILLVGFSIMIIEEKPPVRDVIVRSANELKTKRFEFLGQYSILVAKELIDVRRSKMLSKIIFSFCVPLILISFGSYMVRTGLEIDMDFNLVFYGSLVGFFGIMIYSFLNFTDNIEYYEQLPITVPQVIKAKLLVFIFLTTGISTLFLVIMAIVSGDYLLLPLAFLVMIITSMYMVIITAYLTGLKTNTYLFNVVVLIKFNLMAILPLALVTLTSFMLGTDFLIATLTIIAICAILLIVTYIFFKKIDSKWGNAGFAT